MKNEREEVLLNENKRNGETRANSPPSLGHAKVDGRTSKEERDVKRIEVSSEREGKDTQEKADALHPTHALSSSSLGPSLSSSSSSSSGSARGGAFGERAREMKKTRKKKLPTLS
ncbi:hypothetical protein CSUI_006860 [Cystoisospora suis]|uniref:Uncharacterized protein n=1 Tax=Cystoisospora suis TaxID=483139 RepID=A0A2C6KFN2_9APIC|nr:hypothetical protein CSUI_006860 [Cystoisospora suis]